MRLTRCNSRKSGQIAGLLLIRVSVAKKYCFYQFFPDSCGFDKDSDDNRCIRSEIFLPMLSKSKTSLVRPMFIHASHKLAAILCIYGIYFIHSCGNSFRYNTLKNVKKWSFLHHFGNKITYFYTKLPVNYI